MGPRPRELAADPQRAGGPAARQGRPIRRIDQHPTVLRALGQEQTARLLWHGYVVAACNLHVILDDFELPAKLPTEDEFRALIGQP
jgi:hypothetical protein